MTIPPEPQDPIAARQTVPDKTNASFGQAGPFPEHRSAQIEAWLNKQFPDGVPDTLTVGRKFKSRGR